MWREDDEILEDLYSGQPDRIEAGLRDLKSRTESGNEFEMAPLEIEILKPFGDSVSEEIQLALLDIISNYSSFVPPLTPEQRMHWLISVLLTYGKHYVAHHLALELKVWKPPADAVRQAMQEIVRIGLDSPQHREAAEDFVSYLLDGKDEVRQATIQALAEWPKTPSFQSVVQSILPQLSESEQAQLTGQL
jgi:hypothetical protein